MATTRRRRHRPSPSSAWRRAGFLAGLALVIAPRTVHPCSCVTSGDEPPAPEALEHYDAVFVGQVVAQRLTDDELPRQGDGSRLPLGSQVELEVHRVWKGDVGRRATVHTNATEASCGYTFRLGSTYLVWAEGDDELSVGLCGRTKPLGEARQDLRQLGDPERTYQW